MTAYNVALFAHLLGVVTLFAGIALVETAGNRLRRAGNVEQVRLWVGLTRSAAPLFPVALLTVLGSGLFMAADYWTVTTPWVVVAIVAVVVLGGVGGAVQGRYFAAIARAAAAMEDGPLPQRLSELIAAPVLWVAVVAPDVATVGILWTRSDDGRRDRRVHSERPPATTHHHPRPGTAGLVAGASSWRPTALPTRTECSRQEPSREPVHI